MAPELIAGRPSAGTDQYSLAITYYELRTGRLPFDEAKAIIANLTGQLDLSGVPAAEQEVLRRATHKQPPKRFESCEEFVEALKLAAGVTASTVKVTLPDGVPAPGATGVTVAVNLTAWPKAEGSGDEESAVVVDALPTVWVSAVDVLVAKLASPW